MGNKKREKYLDVAKGIAIISIVLLHIEDGIIPNSLNVFIGSFMISLFFVTTGWLDANRSEPISLNVLIKKRWRQLAIPYLWWSGLILLFDLALCFIGYYDSYFVLRETYKTLTLRGVGTLWFLPALFGGEIIWNIIRQKHSFIMLFFILLITGAFKYIYGQIFEDQTSELIKIIQAPFFTVNNMLSAWIGIAGGFAFRRLYYKLKIDKQSNILHFILGTIICIIAYHISSKCSFDFFWYFIIPIFSPIGVLFLCKGVEKLKISNYLRYWGQNSMSLMVMHYSFIMVGCDIFNRYILQKQAIVGYTAFAYFVVIMIIAYFANEWISKRYPFLFGK